MLATGTTITSAGACLLTESVLNATALMVIPGSITITSRCASHWYNDYKCWCLPTYRVCPQCHSTDGDTWLYNQQVAVLATGTTITSAGDCLLTESVLNATALMVIPGSITITSAGACLLTESVLNATALMVIPGSITITSAGDCLLTESVLNATALMVIPGSTWLYLALPGSTGSAHPVGSPSS